MKLLRKVILQVDYIGIYGLMMSHRNCFKFTHNWDTDDYDLGTGYGHIAINVPDVYDACDEITRKGGVTRPAGPMKQIRYWLLLKIQIKIELLSK